MEIKKSPASEVNVEVTVEYHPPSGVTPPPSAKYEIILSEFYNRELRRTTIEMNPDPLTSIGI